MNLNELLAVADTAVPRLPEGTSTDAVDLYRRAAELAQTALVPRELGVAVAGVLALAAAERESLGMSGCLGERTPLLMLAVEVLALA